MFYFIYLINKRFAKDDLLKELAKRMKELNEIIEKLSYESHILGRQGKLEESWRKKAAAEIARREWKKFNKQHRKLWMQRRKRKNQSDDSQLKML